VQRQLIRFLFRTQEPTERPMLDGELVERIGTLAAAASAEESPMDHFG
jgi:hypothetical protein